MKGVQEKESIMGVRGRQKKFSLAITVWHYLASPVMPDSDSRDGFFYLPFTSIIVPYNQSARRKSPVMYFNIVSRYHSKLSY